MTVAKCFVKTLAVPPCSRAFLVLFAAGRAALICGNLRQMGFCRFSDHAPSPEPAERDSSGNTTGLVLSSCGRNTGGRSGRIQARSVARDPGPHGPADPR